MISQKEKELLVRGILTNSLNNNIYSWKSNPEPEVLGIISKFSKEDPESLAKALSLDERYGTLGKMKYYVLGALGFSKEKGYFKNAFPNTIKDIDDVFNFANILRTKGNDTLYMKLSGLRIDMLRDKLSKISEKELLPYFTKPRPKGEMSLKDLVILLHAKSLSPFLQRVISSLFETGGKVDVLEHELPQLWALKKIEKENNKKRVLEYIEKYDLKWDWVIPRLKKQDPEIWAAMISQLTPTEIVNRLASFVFHDCFSVPYVEHLILSKLREASIEYYQINDPSKIYLGWRNLHHKLSKELFAGIANLLNSAVYEPFKILSEYRIAVFLDISQSMNIKRMAGNMPDSVHRPSIYDMAAVYSLLLLNSISEDTRRFYGYGDRIEQIDMNDNLHVLLNRIETIREDCKSDITLPFYELLDSKRQYDCIFIFTDYDFNSDIVPLRQDYLIDVHPQAFLFLIHTNPFFDEPLALPDRFYRIAEWNDRTPGLVVNTLKHEQFLKNHAN